MNIDESLPICDITYHEMASLNDEFINSIRSHPGFYNKKYNVRIRFIPVTADKLGKLLQDTSPDTLIIKQCGLNNMNYKLPDTIRNLQLSDNRLTELSHIPTQTEFLDCSGNELKRLEGLPDSLRILICKHNPISTISFINNNPLSANLRELDCNYCLLTCLPDLPHTLQKLDCSQNLYLAKLPVLPVALKYLKCSMCVLTELPELPDSLMDLDCSHNKITYLPVMLPTNMDTLNCSANKLTWLPELPNSLTELDCRNNNLTIFPGTIPPGLSWLDCRNNTGLTLLPQLPLGMGHIRLDTYAIPLDESEDYVEITPEIITDINHQHEILFREWLSSRLTVYRMELIERQAEITLNPDRIARLIRNGELGELGTWGDSFS